MSASGSNGLQQQSSIASNASDYAFFPNALAAAFLCPAPPSTFNLNSQRCNKIDGQHPSPLFFQATGELHFNIYSIYCYSVYLITFMEFEFSYEMHSIHSLLEFIVDRFTLER